MEPSEILSGLILELRRGTIVLCVLSQLKKPMYGYHLVSVLQKHGIPVEANTLYPLLRRLESQGLLQSHWETGEGKPRKYYTTTPLGDDICAQLKKNWEETADHLRQLWEEDSHET